MNCTAAYESSHLCSAIGARGAVGNPPTPFFGWKQNLCLQKTLDYCFAPPGSDRVNAYKNLGKAAALHALPLITPLLSVNVLA